MFRDIAWIKVSVQSKSVANNKLKKAKFAQEDSQRMSANTDLILLVKAEIAHVKNQQTALYRPRAEEGGF